MDSLGNHSVIKATLRSATVSDIAKIQTVLSRSVYEICAKDYDNDQEILSAWCENKTEQNLKAWISNPTNLFVVAETAPGEIVGVGLFKRDNSEIDLCYVIPEVLHKGVGSQVLIAMEEEAIREGFKEIILTSSKTALKFYERHNYLVCGPAVSWNGILGYPMRKIIKANA